MSDLLDRESILELLRQLGERLHGRGIEAEIYVVGGTAMVLAHDRTRLTRDVDAVTDLQDEVEREAQAMARGRRDLSLDWFNGRVRPILPRALDIERTEAFRAPGISVSVASPRHLLAMKVRAARGERDLEDIALLCQALGITSASEAIRVADEVWGEGMLREENVFLVTEGLEDRGLTR